MSSLSEDLAALHSLLLDLEEVEEMLATGPRKVATQERLANKKREECDTQKNHITELRKAADGKSLQLKTNEARIEELRGKLNAAGSNREYEIITSQIEADTMANSVLEDEILEALENVDEAIGEQEAMEAAHKTLVEKQKKTAKEVSESAAGLNERAEALRAEIEVAEKKVPTSAVEAYKRLRGAHGAGSLASVENNACENCYSELSPQQRVALNLNKVLFCSSCARLIYRVKA
jgi:predicted  nucleic acid-binding Zn-ribbon protein